MNESILISLEPRHAENILQGKKTVELRRRRPDVLPGTLLWIYSKMPVGSIVGYATISSICEDSPERLWRKFRSEVGVSRAEFFSYFDNRDLGIAIQLENAVPLIAPITLHRLREVNGKFQPPQFFARLDGESIAADAFRELSPRPSITFT